jgi:hypothetical protein
MVFASASRPPISLAMIARRPSLLLALMATTLASLLLAALGPFGTYLNGTFPSRCFYWLATGWLGLALYGADTADLVPRAIVPGAMEEVAPQPPCLASPQAGSRPGASSQG